MRKTTYTLFFSLIIGIIISITSYKQANLDFEKNIKSQSESYNKSDTHKNKTFTISEMLYCNSKNRNVKYEHYFPYKDFYILSYYDKNTNEIILSKFTDGFDY